MTKEVVRSSVSFPSVFPSNQGEISVTRQDITRLMLESHKKADSATEEILALREVAKLNDLYPSVNSKVELSITHVEQSLKELEQLPTKELLRLAGENLDLLELPEPIDAEFEEVEEKGKDKEAETVGITKVMPLEDV